MTTAAIDTLQQKLSELDAEYESSRLECNRLRDRLEELTREREGLRSAIRTLGGDPPPRPPRDEQAEEPRRERPTIYELAAEWARDHEGVIRLRDLLRETKRYGFGIDHGGLHTYLKGRPDFQHSGPGEFRYVFEIKHRKRNEHTD